jgi:hypothetical protein
MVEEVLRDLPLIDGDVFTPDSCCISHTQPKLHSVRMMSKTTGTDQGHCLALRRLAL